MQQALASSIADAATRNETTALLPQHQNTRPDEQAGGDASLQDPHSYSAASEEYMTDEDEDWQDEDYEEEEAAEDKSFLTKAWNAIKGAFIIIANVESTFTYLSLHCITKINKPSNPTHREKLSTCITRLVGFSA